LISVLSTIKDGTDDDDDDDDDDDGKRLTLFDFS